MYVSCFIPGVSKLKIAPRAGSLSEVSPRGQWGVQVSVPGLQGTGPRGQEQSDFIEKREKGGDSAGQAECSVGCTRPGASRL